MSFGKSLFEYQKNAVNGASPVQLVIMLYDGALRSMEQGKVAIQQKNLEAQNQHLQKSQRIILELISCLDLAKGGEIARNLLALYTYVVEQLVTANVENDTVPIDVSMQVLRELRESWTQVDQAVRSKSGGEEMDRAQFAA